MEDPLKDSFDLRITEQRRSLSIGEVPNKKKIEWVRLACGLVWGISIGFSVFRYYTLAFQKQKVEFAANIKTDPLGRP